MHVDNELVLQQEGLELILSFVKQQYEESDKVKLRNVFTGFMENSLSIFQKQIHGSMMITIDAAAELLTQLGVELDESDWNIYKTNIIEDLKKNIQQTTADLLKMILDTSAHRRYQVANQANQKK